MSCLTGFLGEHLFTAENESRINVAQDRLGTSEYDVTPKNA